MNGLFLTPLNVQDEDGVRWRLLTPLVYRTGLGELIGVPSGFDTDLASIPRGLWNVLPKTGRWDRAGTLHDWLYRHPGARTRGQVDDLFREACQACGVGWLRRQTLWLGVRAGGWKPWNTYRAEDTQNPEAA